MNVATFTPVTVTAETLQVLSKQDKYPDLLALYMAYVEITTWQQTNNIKATTDFMTKRLHWAKPKIQKTKKVLLELGLVEDIVRRDNGQVEGHYILIKHVTQPPTGNDYPLDMRPPNTNNLQESTNDSKSPQPSKKHELEPFLLSLAEILGYNPAKIKATPTRLSRLAARIRGAGVDEVRQAAEALTRSPWHMGDNPNNVKYATIDFLIRNDETIERWSQHKAVQAAKKGKTAYV